MGSGGDEQGFHLGLWILCKSVEKLWKPFTEGRIMVQCSWPVGGKKTRDFGSQLWSFRQNMTVVWTLLVAIEVEQVEFSEL